MKKEGYFILIIIFIISCSEKKTEVVEDAKKETVETVKLPEYEIIDETKLLSGDKAGEILIKSFSRNTPVFEREKVLREISRIKGYNRAELYCSVEARKANYSESFSKAHPMALKTCFLGSLKNGKFVPGEKIYP